MAKILIVDDEPSIRTTLSEFVREDGHAVFAAGDAPQALELLREVSPDVVISDIILPRVTGISLLQQISEIAPAVQVIMITGEPTAETAAEAVRAGAFDYLSKPIARSDFRSTVASALRVSELARKKHELEQENRRYQEHLEEEVERKTHALRESEEKYRAVVENAVEAVFIAQDEVLPFANPSAGIMCGRSLEELARTPFLEWVHAEDRNLVTERYTRRLQGAEAPEVYDFRIVLPDGEIRWIELRSVLIDWTGRPATLNFASDITQRKQFEIDESARVERIQERDAALIQLATNPTLYEAQAIEAFRTITEIAARALAVERVSIWLQCPEKDGFSCQDLFELTKGEHAGDALLLRDDCPEYFKAIENQRSVVAYDARTDARTAGLLEHYLVPFGIHSLLDVPIRLEGELVGIVCHEHVGAPRDWAREDISFAQSIAGMVALVIEAANRREAEREREQSESRYRSLFEQSPVSLWLEDYSAVAALIETIGAQSEEELEAYLRENPDVLGACIASIRVEDVNEATLAVHGASSKAELLQGLSSIIPSESHTDFIPQLLALYRGDTTYEGTGIDQRLDGRPIHVAVRWIAVPGFEKSMTRVIVSKLDVTATVQAERLLQEALDGTIQAIGMTTETRDPYTAGHQRRVTELAVAIAEEMGLDQDTIDGTRAAGLLHDIGKMAIPAEILSKPSTLSEMEHALIQSHPQAAFDILHGVTFPWPIAEIVLQHHERMDGSGYPHGLTGDDILIEARILAVADTVEAMASHRPYRAALGIDAALTVIHEQRAVQYDADVADACLRLFAEGRFEFSAPET